MIFITKTLSCISIIAFINQVLKLYFGVLSIALLYLHHYTNITIPTCHYTYNTILTSRDCDKQRPTSHYTDILPQMIALIYSVTSCYQFTVHSVASGL